MAKTKFPCKCTEGRSWIALVLASRPWRQVAAPPRRGCWRLMVICQTCYATQKHTDGFLLSRKISSFHRPQKVFCKMSLSTSLGTALLHQHWCTRDPVHPLPSFRDLCWFNGCCAYFTGEIFHLLLLNVTLHFCFTTGSTRSYWPPGSNWSARPSCEYCQQESCFLP